LDSNTYYAFAGRFVGNLAEFGWKIWRKIWHENWFEHWRKMKAKQICAKIGGKISANFDALIGQQICN